ncbi:GNAT family N-acetyltransferase [Flavobacterium sp. NG2]|uniref:GNAT family N-acetyltransferase n=1 Tax=Flavobacterium sp. NG2 TaxID=3097547 RepID=UPI002A7F44B8|nr:GNAT family N-acetyltransferase [Flavobacterium sp. NG2]WPR70396.1 GNAT family N-acetyltransferase [Flavobacterium sp. NG2]
MVVIVPASILDFAVIEAIARKTWPLAYGQILSEEQMEYMLDSFYSVEKLKENVAQSGHYFVLAKDDNAVVGFASFEHDYNGEKATKIHKLYLLPETQGKGMGKKIVDYIADSALKAKSQSLLLNVNRFNKALFFYQKIGFSIIREEDIDIGQGYLMEDYVMEKKL